MPCDVLTYLFQFGCNHCLISSILSKNLLICLDRYQIAANSHNSKNLQLYTSALFFESVSLACGLQCKANGNENNTHSKTKKADNFNGINKCSCFFRFAKGLHTCNAANVALPKNLHPRQQRRQSNYISVVLLRLPRLVYPITLPRVAMLQASSVHGSGQEKSPPA